MQQATKNHRIPDVLYKQLVKAKQPCFPADHAADLPQGVFLVTQLAQVLMDLQHEAMEMRAACTGTGQGLMKHIHNHRLSPTHTTPEIDSAWAMTGPLCQPSKELSEHPGICDQVIALGQFLV